jgi:hypothetical protein
MELWLRCVTSSQAAGGPVGGITQVRLAADDARRWKPTTTDKQRDNVEG